MSSPASAPGYGYEVEWPAPPNGSRRSSSALSLDFSPPLIAMVAVVGTAFLIVVYFRLISRYLLPPLFRHLRRRRSSSSSFYDYRSRSDVESQAAAADVFETAFHFLSPYGLDETAIKTIPLSVYTKKRRRSSSSAGGRDCAVCLLEFEENDCVRTLPACAHAFHVDCIDIWLRSHANCPLCRACIFRPESPFVPLMAARIRPSFDDGILLDRLGSDTPAPEIVPMDPSPRRESLDRDRIDRRNFLLKRSYSFGFERSLAVDRLVLDTATATPWRYRRCGVWSKRPSPFGTLKTRVFSFRSYRSTKSPFLRRRGFFPLSESSVRFAGGVGSSRRSKSMASPWFVTSRMRCGDPEALLSPERLK
ncbi:RING-H2 finger protein ATL65 [Cinnamomum micranthum f. kanehirae]|uniref:RING-type E3 ubiquitin transferase n=1 Tax=Cinnamomum micranthum f. kanehirae TaxID=337451 RepID=A0A3S3R7K4_9MAGN|nr:RING-H2 finger protein ATL65 [Cinnamomum micranthum f. kanehirae]